MMATMSRFDVGTGVDLVRLADRPELVEVCAAWGFGNWGSQSGGTLQRALDTYTLPMHDDDYETVVAVRHGKAVGMASLWPSDYPRRPDLTPWLAALFVHPEHRGLGLSVRLSEAVEAAAVARGHERLHLITEHHERLYSKSGWVTLENVRSVHGPAALMSKTLVRPAD